MTCPESRLILRLVSGELRPLEESELREHLAACPACQASYAQLQATWGILGAWQMSAREPDLVSAVIRAAEADGPHVRVHVGRIRRWPTALRAAAAIGLAAGLGIAAGYVMPVGTGRTAQTASPSVEADEVLGAMGLAEFGTGSATGLSLGLGTAEVLREEEASS